MLQKAKAKRYEMDMCNGPLFGNMLIFAIPLMCSSLLQLLFNAVDVIVVGKFAGDTALAAVGSNTSLINLLTNFFMGLSIGANVLAARFYAAKREDDLTETVHTALMLSVYSGIILTIVGCFGARLILTWMQTPSEVLEQAVIYLRIYFAGITATMLYNFGSAILRAVGDTQRPLYYLMGAGVINVVLNLIFVIVFKMGVAGVAIATVISQTVSATLVVRCLMREKGGIRLELKKLHIYKDKFTRILKIGLPASFQSIVFSISNVIIQASVNSFGAIVVAGNSAAANIEGFVWVAMNAFHQAALTFTSQNMGAGKYERINKILYIAIGSVFVVGLVLGNTAHFFGNSLLGLYSSNAEVLAAGMQRLGIVSRTYAICGMMDVMVGSLRGMGCSVTPMLVSMIGACGTRLFWIFTFFTLPAFHSVTSLYLTYPVSWILTLSAHIVCFMIVRKKLEKVKNN